MFRAHKAVLTAGVAMALAAAGLSTTADASSAKSQAAAKSSATARQHNSAPDKTFSAAARRAVFADAKRREPAIAKAFGLSKAQQLHVKDVERDADGTMHLRYTRTLGGLKVFGGDFVVHVAPGGEVSSADFAADNPLALHAQAPTKVSALQAAKITAGLVHARDAKVGAAKKVVWAVDGIPRLAWYNRVVGHDKYGNPIPRAVVIDAGTGRRIQSWDLYETAKGTGHSQYVGNVKINTTKVGKPGHIHYVLRDATRGGNFSVDVHNKRDVNGDGTPPFRAGVIFSDKDNVWGNGKPSNRQTAAVDVAYGVAKTWDYYKSTFHRNGIANNGKGTKSRVHYGVAYDNAFWSDGCFCMTYGDGSGTFFKTVTGLDVAGHEMSHGVTSRTAGLYYFGDQGGLNEANSDIFGTMVEFFAHNSADKGDYYIGDKIMAAGQPHFLRRMDHPSLDGVSFDCWTINTGIADPHYSSGPGNHFFYLLAEGSGPKTIGGKPHNSPVCGGAPAVQGVGRDKASAIWYRSLTRYFTSTESYPDARDATIRSAIDLYGAGSTPCKQVQKAWNAVGVLEQYWTCAGKTINEGANALASPGFEPDNSVWTFASQGIVTKNLNFGLPRSGKWYATTNGFGAASNGTVSQAGVTVPDSPTAKLRVYLLISVAASADASVQDTTGTVDITFDPDGGNPPVTVGHWDQTYANNTYVRYDLDMSAFQNITGTLTITGHEDNPHLDGGYFQAMYDDFTLTPR
jgi:Zn-dependent metalloprotease